MVLGSFFGKLLSSSVGNSAGKIADAVDRFVETKEEKKAAEILKLKILQQPDQWQAEINKVEASHRSVFIAGWRPAIGWICAAALGWGWILAPVIETLLIVCGKKVTLPAINVAEALGLVTVMLGNAALRTYEKGKGLST